MKIPARIEAGKGAKADFYGVLQFPCLKWTTNCGNGIRTNLQECRSFKDKDLVTVSVKKIIQLGCRLWVRGACVIVVEEPLLLCLTT